MRFINNTGNSGLDEHMTKLIRYGILSNDLVIDKDEKIYLVDLLEYTMKLNGTDYSKYLIPNEAKTFSDLAKDSSYAKLVYQAQYL